MRALGIDFSKHAYDWELPEDVPVDFAIHRASYGMRKDERFDNHSERMNQVEIRGAYHYYSTAVPWKEQVDFFLDLVLNQSNTSYHAIYWDVEEGYNNLNPQAGREVGESIRYLRMGFAGITGLYCNRDTYTVHIEPNVNTTWLNNVSLWLSVPIHRILTITRAKVLDGSAEPPWGYWRGARYVPLPRPKGLWDIWQYSFSGDPNLYGIKEKKAVDEDVYNGTVEDLKRAWKVNGSSPPPPPPPDCKTEYNQAIETYKDKIIEIGEALKQ